MTQVSQIQVSQTQENTLPQVSQTPVSATLDIQPQETQTQVSQSQGDPSGTQSQGSQGLSETLFAQLGEEYVREGALSDASYETLAKQGIPRSVVDIYMQGLEAQVATMTNKVYGVAGGEESYRNAQSWAKEHWDSAQKEAFNKAMHSGDNALVLLAVQGLSSQYAQAGSQPKEPQLMQASGSLGSQTFGSQTSGVSLPHVFESTAQLTAAMQDKRYGTDEAYRERVKMVLANSRIL